MDLSVITAVPFIIFRQHESDIVAEGADVIDIQMY